MAHKKIEIAQNSIPLYHYSKLASTSQTLHQLIEDGVELPFAVIAEEQSAGRGQWGRVWQSSPGGLYLSLGLSANYPIKNALHLSLIAAWGVAEVLNRGGIPVRLKWPNDLLLGGSYKLGGIKIETRSKKEIITQMVIGIGINWHNVVPYGAINLVEYPIIASLPQLAQLTLQGLLLGEHRYAEQGIEGILPGYLGYLDSLGKTVEINGTKGVVVGVNFKGELRVVLSSPGARSEISCHPGMISLGYY